MSARAATLSQKVLPAALGFGTLLAFFLAVEVLIRVGVINRFIVPMPSQIAEAFGRVIVEEDIAGRFHLTFVEALTAGVDDHRRRRLARHVPLPVRTVAARDRNMDRRTRLGADRADVSPLPRHFRTQRMDHHHDGLCRRTAAGDP